MILRRIIEHVRTQNWTAVALDFVIVVMGVFIGIQVSNWNDARKAIAQQSLLLDRLYEEFRLLEPALATHEEFTRSAYESTAYVINALREGAAPGDEAGFRRALALSNSVRNVPQLATTYKELVSTGQLSELPNTDLRAALIRYGDAHERIERIYPQATGIVFAPGSNYYKAVDWDMDPATWEDAAGIIAYDWERLSASSGEMQGWIAFQYDLWLYADAELAEARRIIAAIETGNADSK